MYQECTKLHNGILSLRYYDAFPALDSNPQPSAQTLLLSATPWNGNHASLLSSSDKSAKSPSSSDIPAKEEEIEENSAISSGEAEKLELPSGNAEKLVLPSGISVQLETSSGEIGKHLALSGDRSEGQGGQQDGLQLESEAEIVCGGM